MNRKAKLLRNRLIPFLSVKGFNYEIKEWTNTLVLFIRQNGSMASIDLSLVRQLRINKKHLVFFMWSGAEYLFFYPKNRL